MRKSLPHSPMYTNRVTHWNKLLARHIAKCGDSSVSAARSHHEEARILQELRKQPNDLPPTLIASTAPWLPSFLHEHVWTQQERTRLARRLAAHWLHARPLQYILQNVQFNGLLLRTRAPVLIPRWGKAVILHLRES
jgi:methylase of polypeptide subunit release factors